MKVRERSIKILELLFTQIILLFEKKFPFKLWYLPSTAVENHFDSNVFLSTNASKIKKSIRSNPIT